MNRVVHFEIHAIDTERSMNLFHGHVSKGSGHATKLGFPTLNIPLADSGISGIFAARVIVGGATYQAAVYADQKRKLLEAHLLDFSEQTSEGSEISIELLKKIREDKQIDTEEALTAAIAQDVADVRHYFA